MYKLIEQFNLLNSNEQIYLLSILNNNFVLLEGIKSARELYSNEIGEEDFNKLAEIDISKTKKYINWICKQYLNNVDINRLKDNISKFDLMANRNLIKNKDINYYKNVEELEDIIEKSPDKSKTEQEKHTKKTKANIILDNDRFFIIEPLTWEASKIYGKGTTWCTAQEDSNEYWEDDIINKNARVFYVRNKKLDIDNPEYKIAIYMPIYYLDKNKKVDYNEISVTLWDANDNSTDSNLVEVSKKFGIDVTKINNLSYMELHTKKGIEVWLLMHDLEYCTVNEDLTIDANKTVDLSYQDLYVIPVKFGIVTGYFYCSHNNLKSLEGCPEIVKGNFECSHNNLESLEGCPWEVDGSFYCDHNPKLKSLEYSPKITGKNFNCSYNNLESLEGCPEEVGWNFACNHNPKLTKEYLNNFDFSFVEVSVITGYSNINSKWLNK